MFEHAQTTPSNDEQKVLTVVEQILVDAVINRDFDTVIQILMFLRPDTAKEMNPDVVDALLGGASEQRESAPPAELESINQALNLMNTIFIKV